MTQIVHSEIWSDSPQIDGRRWVTERHVDDEGEQYFVTYMAEKNADASEMLPVRATLIEEEIERIKNTPPPEPTYKISEIEAAFANAEKGGISLEKLKESLGKVDAGEIIVVPVDPVIVNP